MTLHLVRHGRPIVAESAPASEWELDPAGYDDVWALRERLPVRTAWFSSPETKAQQTAQLLTDGPVGVLDDLREQVRGSGLLDDFVERVHAAFAHPDEPAAPGWEPLARTRERVVGAVRRVLDTHRDQDVALVGHGTAWTRVAADLTGEEPDLVRWESLGMPDVITVPTALR